MLAPPAMPLCSAIQPACRPITSTTSTRWCDSAVVRTKLIELVDEEFDAFATRGTVPGAFNLGYPVLNDSAIALARPMIAGVKIERAALAKKQAEEAEKRRKDELTRAEEERKAREEKATAEAAKTEDKKKDE